MAEPLAIAERPRVPIATIMGRGGVDAAAIGAALGLAAPEGPGRTCRAELELIGTGPRQWLAIGTDAAPAGLGRLDGIASVSDQSGAYVLLRLAGTGARTLLQRGVAIDIHPAAFAPGSAATTLIAHIGVILWQVDAAPTFDLALFRSYAASFRHWLDATAASLP